MEMNQMIHIFATDLRFNADLFWIKLCLPFKTTTKQSTFKEMKNKKKNKNSISIY